MRDKSGKSGKRRRASLALDVPDPAGDGERVDLASLAGHRPAPSAAQQAAVMKAGAAAGFVSRRPPGRRRVSPYQAQFGGKCRPGVKALFQEAATRLEMHDTEALELAIRALIEQHGFDDLLERYHELTS